MTLDEQSVLAVAGGFRRVDARDQLHRYDKSYWFGDSGRIEGLTARGLDISDLSGLGELTQLRHLDLSRNRIEDTEPLARLHQLDHLNLRRNWIIDLSFALHLPLLRHLDVRNNRVRRLPGGFADLEIMVLDIPEYHKTGIILKGNPLDPDVKDAVKVGPEAVRALLKSQEDEDERLAEVKLVVLGDPQVGKTELVRRICRDAPQSDGERTPDAVAHHLSVRQRTGEKANVTAHVWDPGGPVSLEACLPFLWSQRTAYVVVVDATAGVEPLRWLQRISAAAPSSPIFVVSNKKDEAPDFDLDRAALRRIAPAIVGFFDLSCETGLGVDAFLDDLWSRLPTFELPQQVLSARALAVKDELGTGLAATVPHAQAIAICEERGVTDPDVQQQLLSWLHDLGRAIRFPQFALADRVVCDPVWLGEAVCGVLEDEGVRTAGGLLSRHDLDGLLASAAARTLTPDERRFVAGVMEAFRVIVAVPDDHVMVPALLPSVPPSGQETGATLPLAIRFSGPLLDRPRVHAAIAGLVADHEEGTWWRDGVALRDDVLDAVAEITWIEEEARLEVCAGGRRGPQYLVVLRKRLRDELAAVGAFDGGEPEEWIPLAGVDNGWAPYAEVVQRHEAGETTYSHAPGVTAPIADLLASVDGPGDGGTGAVHAANRAAVPRGDRYCFVSYATEDLDSVAALVHELGEYGLPMWYSEEGVRAGAWEAIIERKLVGCALMLLMVSPSSKASDRVADEIEFARGIRKQIVPVMLVGDLEWMSGARLQRVDAEPKAILRAVFDIWSRRDD